MSGNKKLLLPILSIVVAATLLVAVGLFAGITVSDVIRMENKAYEKHKRSIVMFPHKKHVDESKIGCGECHHDENGKPLGDLKEGDSVQNCIECHKIPGERPKKKDAPKLTRKERLAYHAEAIHYLCRDCHKKHNKKIGEKAAPTSCKQCHPPKKKK